MTRLLAGTWLVTLVLGNGAVAQDPDRDGDGLSDIQERHKYGTDPTRADSDGDGIADGDWGERREFAYTVRCVVQVMRPVTVEHLDDDYQDVKVLKETDTWVELEVVHYPWNTVADAITPDPDWRRTTAGMQQWTAPGPTADWTPRLRDTLRAALAKDGIDAATLDDRTLVVQASTWLLQRAQYRDGFTTFLTSFDARGKPFVEKELRAAAASHRDAKLTLEQQWERELSARGMFEHRTRGSCSSTAIYLNGCLRALGIPTRTVLCIPLVDASDPDEVELARRGLTHASLRAVTLEKAKALQQSWTSHTFNEVFVGGRWRRLNENRLGQNSLDFGLFGLMTHVGTWSDWADAKMPRTIGRRQLLPRVADTFGGANPYSTIALADQDGVHRPVAAALGQVARAWWSDDPALPAEVRANLERKKVTGLIAELRGPDRGFAVGELLGVESRLVLSAPDSAPVEVALDAGCRWDNADGSSLVFARLAPAAVTALGAATPVRVRARAAAGSPWSVPFDLELGRRQSR